MPPSPAAPKPKRFYPTKRGGIPKPGRQPPIGESSYAIDIFHSLIVNLLPRDVDC